MPRHLISDAHEWINEIPPCPVYYPAKPRPRERAWRESAGKEDLLSLTLYERPLIHTIGHRAWLKSRWREATVSLDYERTPLSRIRARSAHAPAVRLPPAVGACGPQGHVSLARSSRRKSRGAAALKYNFHRAAGRILCGRLKYATGVLRRRVAFFATIRRDSALCRSIRPSPSHPFNFDLLRKEVYALLPWDTPASVEAS
ncbi:hypothetical protein RND71_019100 [Anisodus tanguticus]|uniref:Uncharacterized protein n=1 Tax=Anisodus tanguticus TaxID=243964 RepID=A0AAE1RYD3_9SOLA|nr:hypothetical protein RND71_019100 [Anisodus tanguticus]